MAEPDVLTALVADLRAVGRGVPERPVDDALVESVLARVAPAPVPRRPRPLARHPRRTAVAAVVAALVALLAAPPVRAAVADWFGIGSVLVREEPGPAPSSAPPAPTAGSGSTLGQAARRAPFAAVTLTRLGRPDGVALSGDRRVLSLTWGTGDDVVRLDQVAGTPEYALLKSATDVEFTEVGGDFAVWFDRPHEVVALAPDGTVRTAAARLAGRTLIWVRGDVTLRLEGDLTQSEAVRLADSARELRR